MSLSRTTLCSAADVAFEPLDLLEGRVTPVTSRGSGGSQGDTICMPEMAEGDQALTVGQRILRFMAAAAAKKGSGGSEGGSNFSWRKERCSVAVSKG